MKTKSKAKAKKKVKASRPKISKYNIEYSQKWKGWKILKGKKLIKMCKDKEGAIAFSKNN